MSSFDNAVPSEPKVAVVTPIHNGVDLTVRMLDSFERVAYGNFEVILVDLGSDDGSRDTISQRFPGVTFVQGSSDMWWSAGTNAGIVEALRRGCEYVFTINNDVVVEPEVLSAAVRTARRNPGSLVGCKVLEMDRPSRVWFFGQGINRALGDVVTVSGRDEDFHEERPAQMLTGMGMLIPRDTFDAIGFLDSERFPHYFGDSDFSLRAKAHGYRLLVTPEARIYNDLSSSWPARAIAEGRLRFLFEMVTSERSPHSLELRARFYRLYWGPGWRSALVRLYVGLVATYIRPLLRSKLRRWWGGRTSPSRGEGHAKERIALCHEWLTTYGGSEQVAARIARALGVDQVFTLTARAGLSRELFPTATVEAIHPIGRTWFAQQHWPWMLPIMGFLWRRLDLAGFSSVLTSSHASVNSIKVPPGVPHLSYCHTPMRYAWEWRSEAHRLPQPLRAMLPLIAAYLRVVDRRRSRNVTAFAANSRFVADRIQRYYGRSATVIYPPIDTSFWSPGPEGTDEKRDHFLLVGRLVGYKRADVAVRAAAMTGLPLVVAGYGPDLPRLREIAPACVSFVEEPSREELRALYRSARALVFPGVEDFGMTMIEAQACGTPVIARGEGGAIEAVRHGDTGLLYPGESAEALANAMSAFDPSKYQKEVLLEHARRFDSQRFDESIRSFVDSHAPHRVGGSTSR